MATPAQIEANRLNAQRSTGPRTPEGKAAVAKNRTTHGLTGEFRILACENEIEFSLLLLSYEDEYSPKTPTERFLVNELAQAQWKLRRADAIEAELLSPGDNPTYADIAAAFRDSEALTRLGRYAQAARRAYYKAQEKLQALREARARCSDISPRRQPLTAPLQTPRPIAASPRPMPVPPQPVRDMAPELTAGRTANQTQSRGEVAADDRRAADLHPRHDIPVLRKCETNPVTC